MKYISFRVTNDYYLVLKYRKEYKKIHMDSPIYYIDEKLAKEFEQEMQCRRDIVNGRI